MLPQLIESLVGTYLTVDEVSAILREMPSTIKFYTRIGLLPSAVKIGRKKLIHRRDVDRILKYGTSYLLAELRYAQDERGRTGSPDLETSAREAALRARARSAVANAKLRQAQRADLAALDAKPLPISNNPVDALAEVRELNPIRLALLLRELGAKPVNAMNDDEIFELIRRLAMATAIPAVEPVSQNLTPMPTAAELREQSVTWL